LESPEDDTVLDRIRRSYQAQVDIFRSENIVRVTGERITVERVMQDVAREIRMHCQDTVELSSFRSMATNEADKRGLLQRKALDIIGSFSKTVIERQKNDVVRPHIRPSFFVY
jgi:hypothetical protein